MHTKAKNKAQLSTATGIDQKSIPEPTKQLITSFNEIIKSKQYEKIFEFDAEEMEKICLNDKKNSVAGLKEVFDAAKKQYNVFYPENFVEDLVDFFSGIDPNKKVPEIILKTKIKKYLALEKKRNSYYHNKDYKNHLDVVNKQIKLIPFSAAEVYGTRASILELSGEQFNHIFSPRLIDITLTIWISQKGNGPSASLVAIYYFQRFSLYFSAKNIPQLTKNLFCAAKTHPADLNIKSVIVQHFDYFDDMYLKQLNTIYPNDTFLTKKLKEKGLYEQALIPIDAKASEFIPLSKKPIASHKKSKAMDFFKIAKFYYQTNDLESSISYCHQALQRDQTNPKIYLLLFSCHRSLGELSKARGNLNWMKMYDPNNTFETFSKEIIELEAKRLQEEHEKLLLKKAPIIVEKKQENIAKIKVVEPLLPLKTEAELKELRDKAKAERSAKLRAARLARKPEKEAKLAEEQKKLQAEKEKLEELRLQKELEKQERKKTRKEKRAEIKKFKVQEEIKLELPLPAKKLMGLLPKRNIYVVGGAVRNLLNGDDYKDLDMIADATADEIEVLNKQYNLQAISMELEDGLIVYRLSIDGALIDLRLKSNLNSLEEDALERDLTVNALYLDRNGMVIDPLKTGIQDTKNELVRFIDLGVNCFKGKESKTIKLLRTINYIASSDLELKSDVKAILTNNKNELNTISPHRASSILNKLFTKGYGQTNFDLLKEVGFIDVLFKRISNDRMKNSIWLLNEIAKSDTLQYPSLNHIFMVMVVSSLEKPSVEMAKKVISEEPIMNARLSVIEDLDLKLANTIGKWNCYHTKTAQVSPSIAPNAVFFSAAVSSAAAEPAAADIAFKPNVK